jgi:hypothetical protein
MKFEDTANQWGFAMIRIHTPAWRLVAAGFWRSCQSRVHSGHFSVRGVCNIPSLLGPLLLLLLLLLLMLLLA